MRIVLALFLGLVVSTPVLAQKNKKNVSGHKENLQDLKKEINEKKKEVTSLTRKESSLLSQLDDLDRKIDKSKQRRTKLEKQRIEFKTSITKKKRKIRSLKKSTENLRQEAGLRVRSLYKLGDVGFMRLILGLKDLRDFSQASMVVRRVVQSDLDRIDSFKRERVEIEQESEKLAKATKKLGQLVTVIDEERSSIRQQKKRQRTLLRLTRNQKDFHLRSISELEQAAKNLQNLIGRLSSNRRSTGFVNMKGALSFPTTGSVAGGFGSYTDTDFQTKRRRSGIEIRSKAGQAVTAIYKGTVLYANWFKGYGKIVIIDHGHGYYSMSAHLSEIIKKEGDPVVADEKIGSVGNTGSFKGDMLYFELRHQGQAVNPMPWFNPLKVKQAAK